jgi:hypothetical protein
LEYEPNAANVVIASEVKQIQKGSKERDCFVALLLAMTSEDADSGEIDESDWPGGMERRRQDHLVGARDPAPA